MNKDRIIAIYFSPTGNSKTVTCRLAEKTAELLNIPCEKMDWTTFKAREGELSFKEHDLVIVGSPTYAGKLPNKILPDFQTKLKGNGAYAVGIVTFGNRSFDNALAEMCATLEMNGFHTVAGGAFVGTHAFSDQLATGRPNDEDLMEMDVFAKAIAEKVQACETVPAPVCVQGDAEAPYYVPKGVDGQPVKFLKAKPKTKEDLCVRCGLCARNCPMGSIELSDPLSVTGACIKCQRCVHQCPKQAKYFDDEAFLSHVKMLEDHFQKDALNYMMV